MDEKTRKTLAEEAQALQHKAGKTKTKYKTLHRGMVLSVEDARSMFTPNSTYTFDTLTATATDKGIASIYTNVENMAIENGVPVMIEIQKPDGIYGFDRDGAEVLLPKGSEFKVTRNWMDKDGVVHVSMYSKKGNNIRKSDDIPFIDSKKANLAKASDDWFEYENAQFMREAVRTGTVPVVAPDGSILPDGGDDGGGGSDRKSKTAGAALARLEKKIHKVYDVASKEVQAKLDDYMRRFKIKDEIKQRMLKQGLITEAEYKKWRTGQIMIGKRWEEMQAVLAQDLTNANRIAASMINDHTPDAYAIGRNYAAFEVEAGSLINTSFTLYDRYTVERLVRDNPKLLPKARIDIPKDLRWNKQKLNSAITQGILQGEDLNKVSRRLQSVTDMDRSSAIRNARTMMTSAENGGRFDSYLHAQDDLGINMEKQWLATLDGRTRHSHAAQDGEHVPVKEEFSNGLMFPADPDGDPREVYNCRCTMIAVVGDMDPSVNPSDVERNSRLGGMDYEDWLEEHMEVM